MKTKKSFLLKKSKISLVLLTLTMLCILIATFIFSNNNIIHADTIPTTGRAVFLPGQEFNIRIKTLAGNNNPTYFSNDTYISAVKRANAFNNQKTVKISPDNCEIPIYAWFDNNVLYWYTEDPNPLLNEDASYMFSGCNALSSLDITSIDTSNTANMSFLFAWCSSLHDIDLSNFKTENVTNMRFMFYCCNSLEKLDLSHFKTSKVTNMDSMFALCRSLVNLNLSSFDTANVTSMNSTFSLCNVLSDLDISNFDTSKVTNMSDMFSMCGKIEKIYASPKFVTTAITDDTNMFANCFTLVGGNGTKWTDANTNSAYARIDSPNNPGYFRLEKEKTKSKDNDIYWANAIASFAEKLFGK